MALPIDLVTLDYADGGTPFVRWAATATGLVDTASLDVAFAGLPFVAQLEIVPVDTCVVTITANGVEFVVVSRKYPNKRQEMVGETQIKQISPLFGAQYSQYIP
jgi:hypothetical protein